jgi:hypothetical protein
MLAGAVAGAALIASYGSAVAQIVIEGPSAGVYVGPPSAGPPYDDNYTYRARPRVYGYYRYYADPDDGDVVVSEPRYRSSCGPYRYWNGDRCVTY